MVKKKFIDKKRSVTYSLIYRSTEDSDAPPERTLLEASRGNATSADIDSIAAIEPDQQATTQPASRYPPGHPLAWLEEEQRNPTDLSDERRRELVELGFPDDGYDYLKHLRTLGSGAGSLEGLKNPTSEEEVKKLVVSEKRIVKNPTPTLSKQEKESSSSTATGGPGGVFVKAATIQAPEVDVAVFDAAQLMVLQAVDVEEAAEGLMGGVTAFSRRKEVDHLGAQRRDVEEIEAMMEALEEDDDDLVAALSHVDDVGVDVEVEAAAAAEHNKNKRIPTRILGEGDLLDDFILSATQGAVMDGIGRKIDDEDDDDDDVWSTEEESEEDKDEESEEEEDDEQLTNKKPAPRPGSIASTYWRDERTDRKNLLGVIDERFEQLALEYDEDEIGSMEGAAEAGEIQGFADVLEFDTLLNEFLEEQRALRGGGVDGDDDDDDDGNGDDGDDNLEKKQNRREVVPGGRLRGESILKERLEAAGFDDADAEVAIEHARRALRRMEDDEGTGKASRGDTEIVKERIDPTAGWDCESILSMRSNLYNHPGTISEPSTRAATSRQRQQPSSAAAGVIRLNKFGIPITQGVVGPTHNDSNEGDGGEGKKSKTATGFVSERKKDESAEEKKARKAAVKEAKRDARATKKELKSLYKVEAVKAQKRAATAQVQPSVLL